MGRPVVVLASRHRPHEQLLLAYSALLCVAYFVRTPPATMAALLPDPALVAWIIALGVGGLLGLVGCWWRGERGLGLEMGGLLINTGALLIYTTAVFAAFGWAAVTSGGVILAWVAANLWRVRQAHHDLRDIRQGSA